MTRHPRRTGALGALSLAALAATALLAPAEAATPADGRIDGTTTEVTWTGTVPVQTVGFSGVGCQVAVPDPTCDVFTLEVGDLAAGSTASTGGGTTGSGKPHPGQGGGRTKGADGDGPSPALDVLLGIGTDAPGIAEFDLYLYAEDGTELARATELGSDDRIEWRDVAPGTYLVAVQSPLSQDPAAEYRAFARVTDLGEPTVRDEESVCGLESVDGAAGSDPTGLATIVGDPLAAATGATSAGRLSVDVLVLLDAGMPREEAEAILARAQRSYEALDVDLTPVGFEVVDFGTDDAAAINAAARAFVGGVRPAGVDVVHTITTRDIQQLGQTAVAGLAECIGGVAHPDRAFSVAEGRTPSDYAVGPVVFGVDANAVVTAHEIGHLLGGQHHYGNCAEGVDGDEVDPATGTGEGTPCSLMFNAADFIEQGFSTANALVVRGMVAEHAAP